ncbi:hypothetical protein C0991_000342 [Blastosporella zonata]|nr:hypothetical protein C0991_000342 [Blastosporella zonata]
MGSRRGAVAGGGIEDVDRLLEMVIPDREVRGCVAEFLQGLRGQFPGGLREMLEWLGPESVLGQVQRIIGTQDELRGGGVVEMPSVFALVGGERGEDLPAPAPPVPAAK